jgi:V8-like Glu-specific endopeptidase
MNIQTFTTALFLLLISASSNGAVFIGNKRMPLPASHPVGTMVGRLFFNGKRICTASMVGPNVLLTAAHCFFDERDKIRSGTFVFKAGYSGGKAAYQSTIINSRINLGTSLFRDDEANDWAVANLDHPIGLKTGWFEIKTVTAIQMAAMKLDSLQMITYAQDFMAGESPLIENCKLTGSGYRSNYPQYLYFSHNCSSTPGGSGSPIFTVEKLPTGDSVAYLYLNSVRGSPGEISGKQIAFSDEVANAATPVQWFYKAMKDYRASSVGADLIWKFKSE